MKEQILKLRKEGKSYRQIQKQLGCSTSTISYHCGKGQKEKTKNRQLKRRGDVKSRLKKRLSVFKSRSMKMKVRDFKRVRELTGNFKIGGGKLLDAFTVDEVINKIIDNPICYLTGDIIDLKLTSSYSFDHIVPVSRGGSSKISNLGLCTKDVNMSKHKLTVEEYITLCKKVLINNGYKVTKI